MLYLLSTFLVIMSTTLPSPASATIKSCLTELISYTRKQARLPIGEQRIARQSKSDEELARKWLWRESDRKGQAVVGLNIASSEVVAFIVSVNSWKSLTDEELRGLIRIQTAFFLFEFLNSSEPFPALLNENFVTDEDIRLWKVFVGKPFPTVQVNHPQNPS